MSIASNSKEEEEEETMSIASNCKSEIMGGEDCKLSITNFKSLSNGMNVRL